ncbi:MAG: hypothetical protein R8J94_09235 [Acidimicrobiia bacterium]|nr:hypothetical protein [Acidimicrobiia bacterium]
MGIRHTSRSCRCAFRAVAPSHHDRLLDLERNPFNTLVELVEMATTWHELEYGIDEPVIGPDCWLDFAMAHTWTDQSRVIDLMISLGSIARPRRVCGAEAESYSPMAEQLASVTAIRPHPVATSATSA